MQVTIKHSESHEADKKWLKNKISLIKPDHDIFYKGYTKPNKPRPLKVEKMIVD